MMMELCLTHLEVWAARICREEELSQVGGMSVSWLLPGEGPGLQQNFISANWACWWTGLLAGAGLAVLRWIWHEIGLFRMGPVLWKLLVPLPSFISQLYSRLLVFHMQQQLSGICLLWKLVLSYWNSCMHICLVWRGNVEKTSMVAIGRKYLLISRGSIFLSTRIWDTICTASK